MYGSLSIVDEILKKLKSNDASTTMMMYNISAWETFILDR